MTLCCDGDTLRTVVQPAPQVSATLLPAPQISATLATGQGPSGPAGPAGPFNDYVHSQAVAAATWVINHNLNRNVNVSLRTAGGAEFEADVLQVSLNQVQALLAAPQAGTARVI